ncbi:MAG: hypothetical protein CL575_08200 [Altererythrobacter sp.]|nr:hypothetical protein [Erythrobacter sp.]MAW89874.1 hypothetical protein [Altererythrobacter sp.]MBK62905.1 hypothetical protein [Altererythrobacter sp.]|tara:strand:- start:1038 stop:2219 length:1182 start_codon:yes stop_codon:yes gene_type:complete
MGKVGRIVRALAIPDLPQDVRADYVIAAATQVQKQARWLFVALLLTCPLAIFVTPESSGWFVRWVLPLGMSIYCLSGLLTLFKGTAFEGKPWRAEKFIVESWFSSLIGAMISTSWAIASWLSAEGFERLHFPVILVMGALATAYCVASIRAAAAMHLLIDIVPIAALLLIFGTTLDRAAAVSLALAGIFQWRMINMHHQQVVELLLLQRKNHTLALTDPLTGLLNRRALLDFAEALGDDDGPSRLLLIDIDRFKQVNDMHGHDVGDCVLQEIARVIESYAGNNVSAARLGGEEFALLGTREALPCSTAETLLDKVREAAMPHGERITVSIGIAEGTLEDDPAWRNLYRQADDALYEAKRCGRDRACHADELEIAGRALRTMADSRPGSSPTIM